MANLDRLIVLIVRGEGTRDNFNRLVPGVELFNGRIWAELRTADRELDFDAGTIRYAGRPDVPHPLEG